jgi:SAM-dependent methyltransferase
LTLPPRIRVDVKGSRPTREVRNRQLTWQQRRKNQFRETAANANRRFRRQVLGKDNRAYISPVMLRHLARYRFAAQRVRGMVVLDGACGSGYGKEILSAGEYTGIDIDPDAVRYATINYGDGFIRGSVADLPLADESVDAVVSFETLEHLGEPDRALEEFARVLRLGGVLLGSLPLNHPDLIFHRRVYRFSDALTLLEASPFVVRDLVHQQHLSLRSVETLADTEGGTLIFVVSHRCRADAPAVGQGTLA